VFSDPSQSHIACGHAASATAAVQSLTPAPQFRSGAVALPALLRQAAQEKALHETPAPCFSPHSKNRAGLIKHSAFSDTGLGVTVRPCFDVPALAQEFFRVSA
jgi:hypothetical protein